MDVKQMRIKIGDTTKYVKRVLTKKNDAVETMYNFCKTLMTDGVSQDGLIQDTLYKSPYEIGKWGYGVIYDAGSVNDNTYDYCGFEMDYEVTGLTGRVEIPAAGKTIIANGDTITGTCSGSLTRKAFKISEVQESESGTGVIVGYREVNAVGFIWRVGTPQEVGHTDAVFTVKRLIFIK